METFPEIKFCKVCILFPARIMQMRQMSESRSDTIGAALVSFSADHFKMTLVWGPTVRTVPSKLALPMPMKSQISVKLPFSSLLRS